MRRARLPDMVPPTTIRRSEAAIETLILLYRISTFGWRGALAMSESQLLELCRWSPALAAALCLWCCGSRWRWLTSAKGHAAQAPLTLGWLSMHARNALAGAALAALASAAALAVAGSAWAPMADPDLRKVALLFGAWIAFGSSCPGATSSAFLFDFWRGSALPDPIAKEAMELRGSMGALLERDGLSRACPPPGRSSPPRRL